MALAAATDVFSDAPFRWWVSGGRALELHVGRSWRAHEDTDIGLLRRDAPGLRSVLAGWDIHVAAGGRLTQWDGGELFSRLHQNNLWCRRSADGPWLIDVTVSDGDGNSWVFRRDPSLRVPWPDAVLLTVEGIPYLAPELQLLFKSRDRRDKDEIDAREAIPLLETSRQATLAQLLPVDHPWQHLAGKR